MTNPQLPAVADASYLTGALRKAGVLDRGAVREVTMLHARDTVVSHVVRLGLRYVGDAAGAPQTLFLKIPHSAYVKTLVNAGRHELAFYTQLAPKMPAQLVPRCFDGAFDEQSLAWHLLLEDLTDTHQAPTPPGPCRRRPSRGPRSFARLRGFMPRGGMTAVWVQRSEPR